MSASPTLADVFRAVQRLERQVLELRAELGLTLARAFTPAQAARQLSVSTRTLWRMVAARELKLVRVGRRRMVPATEIDRLSSPKAAPRSTRTSRAEAAAALAALRADRPPRKRRNTGNEVVR